MVPGKSPIPPFHHAPTGPMLLPGPDNYISAEAFDEGWCLEPVG